MTQPSRGEIWLADLDPTRGREQAGQRPVLIVSEDLFNHGPADLVIICPLTSTLRRIPAHIHVTPPEGGLRMPSAILCDAVRTIAKTRSVTDGAWLRPTRWRKSRTVFAYSWDSERSPRLSSMMRS